MRASSLLSWSSRQASGRVMPVENAVRNSASNPEYPELAENWPTAVLIVSLYYVPLYALPTVMSRKGAGAAPCPVPIVCIGGPLPELGDPLRRHSAAEQ